MLFMPVTEEQKQVRAEVRQMNEALRDGADVLRHEAKRRKWHERWMFMIRDQTAACEPSRSWGLPVIDGVGSWPPVIHPSEEERVEHDAAEAMFNLLHPDCHAQRWGMEGSRTSHCGLCCPPLPLSPCQIETVLWILNDVKRHPEVLDIRAATLTCSHRVELEVHSTSRHWSASTLPCVECGVTRGVVASERVVVAADRKKEIERKRATDVSRAQMEDARAEKSAAIARKIRRSESWPVALSRYSFATGMETL